MMRTHDRWVAVFLLLMGVGAAAEASRLHIGEPSHPEPGFFPFCLAAALCVTSLALLLYPPKAVIQPSSEKPDSSEPRVGRKIIWTLVALGSYAFTLEPLGFALSTFLFLLSLHQVVEPGRWPTAIGVSALITLVTYGLFYLLGVRLPAGAWIG